VVPPEQEVRVAAPGAVKERGLVHDVRACARWRLGGGCAQLTPGRGARHRRSAGVIGLLASGSTRAVTADLDDRPALGPEILEVPALVLRPRLAISSIEGSVRTGFSTRPCMEARSSASRCPHARKPTRSVAA
jgi:hypothetical protein